MIQLSKAAARVVYRDAWQSFLLASPMELRRATERAMDAVQPYCVGTDGKGDGRPGEEWLAFVTALPGYLDYWNRLAEECEELVRTAVR